MFLCVNSSIFSRMDTTLHRVSQAIHSSSIPPLLPLLSFNSSNRSPSIYSNNHNLFMSLHRNRMLCKSVYILGCISTVPFPFIIACVFQRSQRPSQPRCRGCSLLCWMSCCPLLLSNDWSSSQLTEHKHSSKNKYIVLDVTNSLENHSNIEIYTSVEPWINCAFTFYYLERR